MNSNSPTMERIQNAKNRTIKRRDVILYFRDGSEKKYENVYTTTVSEGIVGVSLGPKNGKIIEYAFPLDTIKYFEANAFYDEVPTNVHAQ